VGFASLLSDLRTDILADALGWATDFVPIIALVVGLLVFGLALQILRRFV